MTASEQSKRLLRELSKLATTSRLSINELRVVLALERIVARIHAHRVLRDKLVFKGGYVLLKSYYSQRFTRDLDALAVDVPQDKLIAMAKEAIGVDLDDGVHFAEPEVQDLLDQGQYGGYRIKVPFQIGPLPESGRKLKKLSRVHLDIGFGDVYFGRAKRQVFPQIIVGDQPVSWKVYPIESIYAEKLETRVSRESANSRAKDLYDLVVFYDEVSHRDALASAIRKTFQNRKTALPESFVTFVNQLDFTILERSWGGVELAGGKMGFEDCISRLKRLLKMIDVLLSDERRD